LTFRIKFLELALIQGNELIIGNVYIVRISSSFRSIDVKKRVLPRQLTKIYFFDQILIDFE